MYDPHLCLGIITGDNIADGPKSRSDDRGFILTKQFDETRHHVGIDHALDFVVGAVRQVGQGPTCVREYLQKLSNGKSRLYSPNLRIYI